MDFSMPEFNGLMATRELKGCCPALKILHLTRHTETAYLQELLRTGPNGYVLKQSSADVLLCAVRAIASCGNFLDPAITGKVVVNSLNRQSRTPRKDTPTLNERETHVLRLIANGYTNKEIAKQMGISVKTVEAHRANAMRKLDITSRVEIVHFAVLQGWLDEN